ncbi:MAG: hypothetical protein Q9202_005139 [Teloschistes flavicans]
MSLPDPASHPTVTRPQTHHSKSFTRMDPVHSKSMIRHRANTLQDGAASKNMSTQRIDVFGDGDAKPARGDIFEKDSAALENSDGSPAARGTVSELPEGFDHLPVELISLIDRFIESLTAKVYPEPPSIDRLSDMFQEFYVKADSHIATHISALSAKSFRGSSPSPSISSKSSGKRLRSMSSKDTIESPISAPEQQMLTPQEVSDRRRTRRLLEQKRVALEEAVERRTCERVYKRVWRHTSTLDEVRDEKLRSRTAALALVGIGLKDLGIDIGSSPTGDIDSSQSTEPHIEEWISPARDNLLRMNEARYPQGKLQHLAAAHKCIVDMLSRIHQSSSSADEILPTLIYTLITSPPEGINVISNLNFTQRFRAFNKIDGEAAYCLTNLEAAISFLETVDLASLRSDESLEGPLKSSSRPSTPHGDGSNDWIAGPAFPSPKGISLAANPTSSPPQELFSDPLQTPPPEEDVLATPQSHNRTRSNLFQPTTNALGAASDAVRSTADQGLKNIGNTLDHSFKFLFGRLKEQRVMSDDGDTNGAVLLPKTLDDARKLVDPPRPAEEEQGKISSTSSIAEEGVDDPLAEDRSTFDEKLLGVFAGRKPQPRDRSVDSLQSSGSGGKKVAFANEKNDTAKAPRSELTGHLFSSPMSATEQPVSSSNSAVESMRNLGNSLNPLNRFAGMSVMRGFGRGSSGTTPTLSNPNPTTNTNANNTNLTKTDGKPSAELTELPVSNGVGGETAVQGKILPPIKRFMEVSDAGKLRVGEVEELLRDYRRLAGALRGEGRF